MFHWRRVPVGIVALAAWLVGNARDHLPAEEVIAYEVPAGTVGNQLDASIALGMEFDVLLDVRVTRLGVFDSGADGLALPLTVRLWDRDLVEEVGFAEFTPEDPGELIGGSRFKPFDTILPAGFRGTIAAAGYGLEEPNGN